jgi:hypothetical protein
MYIYIIYYINIAWSATVCGVSVVYIYTAVIIITQTSMYCKAQLFKKILYLYNLYIIYIP